MVALAGLAGATDAAAQTEPANQPETETTVTTLPVSGGAGSILGPRPGEGVEPLVSGDRGGSSQLLLFGALASGVGAIFLLARRDMNNSQKRASKSIAETSDVADAEPT